MDARDLSIITKKTLLLSECAGVFGIISNAIGANICDRQVWTNLQIVQVCLAGGFGNMLTSIPIGLCYAFGDENNRISLKKAYKKSLIWVGFTGGLGSLLGASVLGLVNNQAKGISATSFGMIGGATIGVCTLLIEGTFYAIMACQEGRLRFGRLTLSENTQPLNDENQERLPILQHIEPVESRHVLYNRSYTSLNEASAMIQNHLQIPVQEYLIVDSESDEKENDALFDVNLNDPVITDDVEPSEEQQNKKCLIM
jgi:hypothetical protein